MSTEDSQQRQYTFYRLPTIGWANPLLKRTLPLISENIEHEILVDLSEVVFMDAFGVTYLAACLERCRTLGTIPKILIRRPKSDKVYQYLLDTGFYESVGISNQSEARKPSKDRVDLVHITALEPLFVDALLDFLEGVQPFAPGLKDSMRMSFYELIQNFAEHSQSASGAWAW
jgi:anti-anti-sigma regulatory factor